MDAFVAGKARRLSDTAFRSFPGLFHRRGVVLKNSGLLFFGAVYHPGCQVGMPDERLTGKFAPDAKAKGISMPIKSIDLKVYAGLMMVFLTLIANACSNRWEKTEKVEASNDTLVIETGDTAIKDALKIIERFPNSPRGYVGLAAVYMKKARESGDFSLNSKAEKAVEKALQLAPEDFSALKLKAALHVVFHRFDEALELGRQLNTKSPNDPFVYGILSDANVELGRYDEAVEAAQKMVDLRPDMISYVRVARLRSLHGDTQGAIEMFKVAAKTADPLDKESQSWCLVQLGNEFWKIGQYMEAEKIYDEALNNFPNYHLALAAKGKVRASQNDFEAAVVYLTEANKRAPDVESIILLGDIFYKQGKPEQAQAQYNLAEVIEDKLGVNNDRKRLALLWVNQDQRLEQALEIARREYAMRKDILTADTLAWCLYKNGFFTEARLVISEALRLKTKEARIYYHAGMIEKALDNRTEAVRLLEKALKMNPAFDLIQAENARKALSELK